MRALDVTLVVLVVAAPLGSAAGQDVAPRQETVVANAIIYEEPTGTSKRLARLEEGDTVRILAEAEGDFWEVEHGDVRGYLHDILLERRSNSETADGPELVTGDEFGRGAHRISDALTPPRLIKSVKPIYTNEALTARVKGSVLLEVVILTSGRIGPIRVLEGLPKGLTEQAIECVRQWKFAPGKLEGKPVDVIAEIEVSFEVFDPRR